MFCGIDPSLTGTGVVIIGEDLEIIEQKLISTKLKDQEYDIEIRMKYIVTEMEFIKKYNSKVVCIEGLSFNSKGQKAAELFGLAYLIRMWMLENDILFKEVPPTVLKKFITGKGQCQKDLMLLKTYKKFGIEFSDNNLCDAYGMARYGAELYRSINK